MWLFLKLLLLILQLLFLFNLFKVLVTKHNELIIQFLLFLVNFFDRIIWTAAGGVLVTFEHFFTDLNSSLLVLKLAHFQ